MFSAPVATVVLSLVLTSQDHSTHGLQHYFAGTVLVFWAKLCVYATLEIYGLRVPFWFGSEVFS